MTASLDSDLTGKLLVAMPGIGDPRFDGAVVFLIAHSPDGSMGLIVNTVSEDIHLRDVFDQLDVPVTDMMPPTPVHFGGPVEMGRGFVLHSSDYVSETASMKVDAAFSMTASRDILSDMGRGVGPKQRLLCLGYAGWGPNQLEAEIAQNGWLTADARQELVFDTPNEQKWEKALASIGVDPALLSTEAGHA